MAAEKRIDGSRNTAISYMEQPDGTRLSWAEVFPREMPVTVPVVCECAACSIGEQVAA